MPSRASHQQVSESVTPLSTNRQSGAPPPVEPRAGAGRLPGLPRYFVGERGQALPVEAGRFAQTRSGIRQFFGPLQAVERDFRVLPGSGDQALKSVVSVALHRRDPRQERGRQWGA